MASVEIRDETVILVARETVAAIVSDRRRWVAWWPGLEVSLVLDEGVEGIRWSVTGPLVGVSEVRLVAQDAGVLVRFALVAEPTEPGSRTAARRMPDSPRGARELETLRRRQALAWKAAVWGIKDEAEASNTPHPWA